MHYPFTVSYSAAVLIHVGPPHYIPNVKSRHAQYSTLHILNKFAEAFPRQDLQFLVLDEAPGREPAAHGSTICTPTHPREGGGRLLTNHRELQFLNVSGPDQFQSKASRKLARTHVAKLTHAKVRRQRMKLYNEANNREPSHLHNFRSQTVVALKDRGGKSDSLASLHTSIQGYNLAGVGPSTRMDPFDSLSKRLSSSEHRLFDHC